MFIRKRTVLPWMLLRRFAAGSRVGKLRQDETGEVLTQSTPTNSLVVTR
jgi:hypothetical protein